MLDSRRMLLALGAGVLALGACSRSPEPATSDTTGSAAPSASVPEPTATAELPRETEPPAESGLAIKRGIAMLASDRATFRPCDEKAELWIVDQTDGVLARTFADELQRGPLKLYLEAYGERAPVAEDIPAARAYGGTFVLEEALYAAAEGQGGGCGAPVQDHIVAARGSEPFWAVEVSETRMVWRQPDEPKEIALGAPQTQDSEGAVRYVGEGDGHSVELMIDAQSCRDPMSGEYFAYAARATLDGKLFTGCARVGK